MSHLASSAAACGLDGQLRGSTAGDKLTNRIQSCGSNRTCDRQDQPASAP